MKSQADPKISIIVPVYCVEDYFVECIESLLHQTYNNIEIILVDDGSPDSCPLLCDEYAQKDARVIVIHKENEGVAKARNVGLERATGDYIGFVDSDDYIDEEMYESLLKLCEENDADMASVRYDEIHENTITHIDCSGKVLYLDNTEYFRNMAFMNNKCFITDSVWTNLYRSSLVEGLSFPNERRVGEDLAFNRQAIIKANKCIYYDKNLYHYRIRNNSVIHTGFKDYKNFLIELLPYYKEELQYFREQNSPVLYYYMCHYYNLIIPLLAEKLTKEESELIVTFLHENKLSIKAIMSIKMPFKTRCESIKKHGFGGLYVIGKRLKNKMLS